MTRTVGTRIAAGYAVILTLLVVVAAVGVVSLPRTTESLHSAMQQQGQRLIASSAVRDNVGSSAANFLRYLLSPDNQVLTDWRTGAEAARRQLAELRDKSPNPEIRDGWTDVVNTMDKLQQTSQRSLDAKSVGNDNLAMRLEFDEVVPLRRQVSRDLDRAV